MNLRGRTAKRVLMAALASYLLGLAWGYVRLPWAAVKDLTDYELIEQAPSVSYGEVDVSATQRRYLERVLPPSAEPVTPRVEVSVRWYAVAFARVRSGNYVGPTGAERKEALYVCLFGAWVPAYTFIHVMA